MDAKNRELRLRPGLLTKLSSPHKAPLVSGMNIYSVADCSQDSFCLDQLTFL